MIFDDHDPIGIGVPEARLPQREDRSPGHAHMTQAGPALQT